MIALLLALAAFLIYHFTVHTIRNSRPLGGANVNVTHGQSAESEASFAIDPAEPEVLFGASNQLFTYRSTNGGRTWRQEAAPAVHEPLCVRGEPHTASDKQRDYLAFLVSPTCSDELRPFLVVTSRASGARSWEPVIRVAPPKWPYGYDDARSLAVDRQSGRVYLAWTRSLTTEETSCIGPEPDRPRDEDRGFRSCTRTSARSGLLMSS